ncbi:RxLR effector protein [Phytophthora megakarya]|uniref:RxLR effector protein n=1 Tax=Phytophthora megakarya TaxID=4795 RepID=A0A225VVU7_9STRA|nr:RxLR effector protein [Phytophthora megakarya]
MREYLIMVLSFIVLVTTSNAVSASTVKLQTPHTFIQSTDHSETILSSQRLLRTEVKANPNINADSEERALPNVFKTLGSSSSKWFQNYRLASRLRSNARRATPSQIDGLAKKLVNDGVDPNKAFKVLGLNKPKNMYVGDTATHTGEYLLWSKMKDMKKQTHSKWKSDFDV